MRSFAIIPAAGRSVRMGKPKLLLPWGERTLIEHVLAAWGASRVSVRIVVVHPHDQPLAEVCRRAGAEVVQPASPPPDMKASVKAGLDYIACQYSPTADDCWLVAPADMPNLSPAVINRVLAAFTPAADAVVVPRCGAHMGHPVLFPCSAAHLVPTLAADEGLNALVMRLAQIEVPITAEELAADVDSPADYHRLREQFGT